MATLAVRAPHVRVSGQWPRSPNVGPRKGQRPKATLTKRSAQPYTNANHSDYKCSNNNNNDDR